MPRNSKLTETVDYAERKPKRDGELVRPDEPVESRIAETRRGVGIDPTRPPAQVDRRTKAMQRSVSVALVIPDALERSNLARALLQARCVVMHLSRAEEARSTDLSDMELVIADFDAPGTSAVVDALRSAVPGLPVLAWTARAAVVERGLAGLSFGRFAVIDRSARIPAVVEAVRQLVED